MKLSVSVALVAAVASAGELSMSPLYSDNAVLQRNMAFPVCGMGRPGASVTVRFAGRSSSATIGDDGRWCAKIGPFAASAQGRELAVWHGSQASRKRGFGSTSKQSRKE